MVQHSSSYEYKFRKFEELLWNPYQLHDNDLQNFIACARLVFNYSFLMTSSSDKIDQ